MQISPIGPSFPTHIGPIGPARPTHISPIGPAFPPFFNSVNNAMVSLNTTLSLLGPGPVHANPELLLTKLGEAQMYVNTATIHPGNDTPARAVAFASQALASINDGISLLTHRLNGPVNEGVVKADVNKALDLLAAARALGVSFHPIAL